MAEVKSDAEIRIARLRELADVVTKGRAAVSGEFTMRIPAEPNRDADLVLSWAADELDQLRAKVEHVQRLEKEIYDLQMADTLQAFMEKVRGAGLHHEWNEFCDKLAGGSDG